MAPQASIPVAANVLGTLGTICWCVQLAPQIWRNYRTKSTEGLPAAMILIWSISGVPFGVYATAQRFNVPLIIQPQCFCALCGVSWAQCLIYGGQVLHTMRRPFTLDYSLMVTQEVADLDGNFAASFLVCGFRSCGSRPHPCHQAYIRERYRMACFAYRNRRFC